MGKQNDSLIQSNEDCKNFKGRRLKEHCKKFSTPIAIPHANPYLNRNLQQKPS
jgi:hypothetical protein